MKLDEVTENVLCRVSGIGNPAELPAETRAMAERVKLASSRVDAGQPLIASVCALIAVLTGAFRLGGKTADAPAVDLSQVLAEPQTGTEDPPSTDPVVTAPPDPTGEGSGAGDGTGDAPPPANPFAPPPGDDSAPKPPESVVANPFESTPDGTRMRVMQGDGSYKYGAMKSTFGVDKVQIVLEGDSKATRFPVQVVSIA